MPSSVISSSLLVLGSGVGGGADSASLLDHLGGVISRVETEDHDVEQDEDQLEAAQRQNHVRKGPERREKRCK